MSMKVLQEIKASNAARSKAIASGLEDPKITAAIEAEQDAQRQESRSLKMAAATQLTKPVPVKTEAPTEKARLRAILSAAELGDDVTAVILETCVMRKEDGGQARRIYATPPAAPNHVFKETQLPG